MMHKNSLSCYLAIAAAAMVTTTASADLISNGGFENVNAQNQPLNWTLDGTWGGAVDGFFWSMADGAHSGTRSLFLNLDGTWYAEQTFTTIANATYDLSFWINHNSVNSSDSLTVSIDGATLLNAPGIGDINTTYDLSFVASSTSTTLRFTLVNSAGANWYADDVTVTPTPEPGPMALLLLGSGLVAGLGWHRRQQAGA